MRLLDGLAELLFPTRCAGCELPGAVLCDALPRRPAAHRPRRRLPALRRAVRLPGVHRVLDRASGRSRPRCAVGALEAPLARAVVLHKDAGERRLAAVLGALLAEQVAAAWPGLGRGVAYVPATRAALRRRGFDHGRAIAVAVAAELGVPLADALAALGGARPARARTRRARAPTPPAPSRRRGGRAGAACCCATTSSRPARRSTRPPRALLAAGAGAVRVAAVARAW